MILGVDPGLNGALAAFDQRAERLAWVEDMPKTTRGTKNAVDIVALALKLRGVASTLRLAVLEDVSAMTYIDASGQRRGQGAAASFAFGKYTGVVEGVLAALDVPILYVKPAVWKLAMGLGSSKRESLELARKRFTYLPPTIFSLQKHDGRAEAALLAVFGAERFPRP